MEAILAIEHLKSDLTTWKIHFTIDNDIKRTQSYFKVHSIVAIWMKKKIVAQTTISMNGYMLNLNKTGHIRTHSCKDIITYLNKWMNYRTAKALHFMNMMHSRVYYFIFLFSKFQCGFMHCAHVLLVIFLAIVFVYKIIIHSTIA